MKLETLLMRSDSNRSATKADRGRKMATEGHRKKSKAEKLAEMDRELTDIRAEIEKLKLWMRQDEELVQVFEPETGKGLDDWDDEEEELGSSDDLKDCHGGREVEIPYGQEDSELRSTENLKDWHEDSQETLHFQLGNERRSDEDLEDCQEGSESIEDCQEGSGSMLNCRVGRGEKLRLSESLMDSMESSIQQELLMKMGSVDLMVC